MSLKIGDKAPPFTLPDQDGKDHSLADYLGQWVLLYFYPKDNTPGCTQEACAIRDSWSEFKKIQVQVLGVSADSVDSHKKFATKHQLSFPLLADTGSQVIDSYGVRQSKSMFGKTFLGIKRMSYLIDENGGIAKIYQKVKPTEHASQVIEDLKDLMKK